MRKLLIFTLLLLVFASSEAQMIGRSKGYVAPVASGGGVFDGGMLNNGDFADDTHWVDAANFLISGGVATFNDVASSEITQSAAEMVSPIHVSTSYTCTFDITLGTGTSISISLRDDADNDLSGTLNYTTSGSKSAVFTSVGYGAEHKGFRVSASLLSDGTFSIDNIKLIITP
jgi:hypothetical protein